MRNTILLEKDWTFYKNPQSESGEAVTLPHTWNAVDGQDGGNDYYRGTCKYVRHFVKPELEKGGRAYLEFDGAAMTADVVVNGTKLLHHEGGFSTFRVDVTEQLTEDNLLEVYVDNSDNTKVYQQKADFTFYGGLYRMVKLVTVPLGKRLPPVPSEAMADYANFNLLLGDVMALDLAADTAEHVSDSPAAPSAKLPT